ncbi:hypothetical protein ACT3UJ_06575 [Halomonas sp. 86]|uniref:hypothetical protein n=1 Tax=unclassified Halomonas TaxID=2609666 RepID=UPI0040342C0C
MQLSTQRGPEEADHYVKITEYLSKLDTLTRHKSLLARVSISTLLASTAVLTVPLLGYIMAQVAGPYPYLGTIELPTVLLGSLDGKDWTGEPSLVLGENYNGLVGLLLNPFVAKAGMVGLLVINGIAYIRRTTLNPYLVIALALSVGHYLHTPALLTEYLGLPHEHAITEWTDNLDADRASKLLLADKTRSESDESLALAQGYVLAQMAVREAESVSGGQIHFFLEEIQKAPAVPGISPSPQRRFAMEHAAYGEARSESATAYAERYRAKPAMSKWRVFEWGQHLLVGGVTGLGVSTGLFAVTFFFSRRIRRIKQLIRH